jgi:hypothetical protein
VIFDGQIDDATGRELAPVAEIEVFDCNAEAVGLYQRCNLGYVGGGMGGLICTGLSHVEIDAACRNYRIDPTPALVDDLLTMASAAAETLNKPKEKAPAHG